MPEVSEADLDQVIEDLDTASASRREDPEFFAAVLERAIALCADDEAAADYFDTDGLLLELGEHYQSMGRWDDALRLADQAVSAGIRMSPDTRCLRAEVLMRSGRVGEAVPIWEQVRVDTPDDVWVYNNAGLEYAAVGDHDTALRWLTDGLEIAMNSGDPERLVDQLLDQRAGSLRALELAVDDLQRRALEFARHRRIADRPAIPVSATRGTPTQVKTVSWAWFPAEDYANATHVCPDIADSDVFNGPDGPIPHPQYCRELQHRFVQASASGITGIRIAPLRLPAFTTWCNQHGHEPDAHARAAYAAHLANTGDRSVIAWPPGRNQPCWCGSDRKYKKCCAAAESWR